ncbi:uncharacterized protein TRIADDRAFT_20878 [Trichoplax adhaerens]|uniref:Proteasome subunit beta n=1 Tax=Trichoplax adhaerens TaxID=10228 RepID=B3RNH6_TRIAD|nr:hypothetical protein TRIADDRAFT_20878 [Trichoplax adhaerens]EDV27456.1 hypothetical protein TRIADDRAFT_20878 [Trichoplax adhaerens]|eukprot:XP_002109290.1 hypothetical protein TRIADDRAFT_20878 [Trichoplax adhaerens]
MAAELKKAIYPENATIGLPTQHRFDPYTLNGGTIVGVAGDNFAILAGDTRLSEGFMIHSRDTSKIYKLTEKTFLGTCGFQGDVLTLTRLLNARLTMYEFEHRKKMSSTAISQMLSTVLYYRRFFPYYTFNILAGIDTDGKGCIYSYDAVGNYEKHTYHASGTASSMLQPLLDNQVGYLNQEGVRRVPLTIDKARTLIKDVFISATERDMYTGDSLHIVTITSDGVTEDHFPLRRD